MPRLLPPSSGIRVLHIGSATGPHRRVISTLQETDKDNEHIFVMRFSDRVRERLAGKNAIGVADRAVVAHRRVHLERADIAQQVRLNDPDVVAFHSDELARFGVIALYGARSWMIGHRYDSMAIPRGVIKRVAYSRISSWIVPDPRGKSVVQAVGIEEQRIKVVRPFFKAFTPSPQPAARQRIGLPDKRTIGVIKPGAAEVAAIVPVFQAMKDYDQGYTLAVIDPQEDVISTVETMAAKTNGQAVVVSQAEKKDAFGAVDAVLNPNWGDNISVDEQAIVAMQSGREVIATRSANSEDYVGEDLIKIEGVQATKILPVLRGYRPNVDRRERLRSRAATRYGMGNMTDQIDAYKSYLPVRSRDRANTA